MSAIDVRLLVDWNQNGVTSIYAYPTDLNLVPNASAEYDTTGFGVWQITTTRVTTTAKAGRASLKHVRAAANPSGGPFVDGRASAALPIPVVAGATYTLSLYARLDVAGSATFHARLEFYDDAGALKGATDGTAGALNTTDWSQRFAVTAAAPAGATKVIGAFYWSADPGVGFAFYTDAWQLEAGAAASAYTEPGAGSAAARFLAIDPSSVSAEPYEDVTAYLRAGTTATLIRGRDTVRTLSPPMAGALTAELDNTGRLFSADNATGPLHGWLEPNRLVQVTAAYGGAVYTLWTGYLDNIVQYPDPNRLSVGVPALGVLAKLKGRKGLSTPLYGDGTLANAITTDQALGYICDRVGIPANLRNFSGGQTKLLWWWLSPTDDCLAAAIQLLNAEGPGAYLGEDRYGRLTFQDRFFRFRNVASAAVVATWQDQGAEPLFMPPFVYDRGVKNVINQCQITVATRAAAGAASAVWSLAGSVTLAPGQSASYVVLSATGDPFTGAVAPVAGTDYTVVGGTITATLDRTSGASCVLTIANPGTVAGVTVSGLQVRAKPVTVASTLTVANTADASASIATYGLRPYSQPTRAEIDPNVAQDFANVVVVENKLPRPTAEVSFNAGTDPRIGEMLAREISDRVLVVDAQTGSRTPMIVNRIGHELVAGGKTMVGRFGCESADTGVQYALWGTAIWGLSDWAF